ncbi:MAG: hypothetical protein KDA61_14950, partial [Planctomycetales bacterium]|nr:hypothetical protein [Planctomycetales bacterium]
RLTALLRIAKQEARFEFRRRGERQSDDRSNRLFDGFDAEDEAEQYFEPVFVRIGAEEGELTSGFPATSEELFQYDAVVVDDLECEFFTPDQQALLQKYVNRRGGSLLMLGGQESFAEGGYDRTPIGDMLPVYLNVERDAAEMKSPFRLSLSKEGWLEPWARLRQNEVDERSRLEALRAYRSLNRTSRPKPGAIELAYVEDQAGQRTPALVSQAFGRGRCVALLVGDAWRNALTPEITQRDDAFKAWRQAVRFLVANVPRRVDIESQMSLDASTGRFDLRITARDDAYEPLDNAQIELTVLGPDGSESTLPTSPSDEQAGVYVSSFVAPEAGTYRAHAVVRDGAGDETGQADALWHFDPDAAEFARTAPDERWLEEIARRTGGEMFALEDLDDLAASLPRRKAPISEKFAYPLWHRTSLFVLALTLLCCEWGWRRYRGLP